MIIIRFKSTINKGNGIARAWTYSTHAEDEKFVCKSLVKMCKEDNWGKFWIDFRLILKWALNKYERNVT
jgi:hypothetical protein